VSRRFRVGGSILVSGDRGTDDTARVCLIASTCRGQSENSVDRGRVADMSICDDGSLEDLARRDLDFVRSVCDGRDERS
jgi:hypothetical protein